MSLRTFLLSAGLAAALACAPGAAAQAVDEVDPGQPVSEKLVDLAGWAIASGDTRGLPFAVVDKEAAQVLVFGADGKLRGMAPALVGSAVGDHSAPGIGDRELKDIPAKDRTTPTGRFHADYGPAAGGQRVLWIDYETAVSIHPVTDTSVGEQREKRLATPTPKDNRVTHGCINVSKNFYEKVVQPTFKKGGVFYVLPDSTPITEVFPGYQPPQRVASAAHGNSSVPLQLVSWDLADEH